MGGTDLVVPPHEKAALAGVDTEAGERVDFDLLHSTNLMSILQKTGNACDVPSVQRMATKRAKSESVPANENR